MELIVIASILLVGLSAARFVFGFAGRLVSLIVRIIVRLFFIVILIFVGLWVYDYYQVYQNTARIDAENSISVQQQKVTP